jgi:hypothetical protein
MEEKQKEWKKYSRKEYGLRNGMEREWGMLNFATYVH